METVDDIGKSQAPQAETQEPSPLTQPASSSLRKVTSQAKKLSERRRKLMDSAEQSVKDVCGLDWESLVHHSDGKANPCKCCIIDL